jgi:hypothetical protein
MQADFCKVCLEDGTPVGFAGWSLEQTGSIKSINVSKKLKSQVKEQNNSVEGNPRTLAVASWRQVSTLFKNEKKRVFENYNSIWRKWNCLHYG